VAQVAKVLRTLKLVTPTQTLCSEQGLTEAIPCLRMLFLHKVHEVSMYRVGQKKKKEKWVKINGSTDMNENHKTCGERN
jgi:hypothetical protein